MKKSGPYIGITGFTSLAEVVACNNTFCDEVVVARGAVPTNLKFMVGILVSSKTLAGLTNRWPNRYPSVKEVSEILSLRLPHLLRTIHYNTDDPATLDEQVDQIMSIAPLDIDALQLNIRWASHVRLQKVKRKYPDLRIILQVGAGALADVDEPGEIYLGEALRAYDGVADDFLVDPSGGKGEAIDIWKAFACLADNEIPGSILPGVAGGRNADNIRELKGLIRRLGRPVNFDAERRLRTPGVPRIVGDTEDRLDLNEAARYISASVVLVAECWKSYREYREFVAVR